MTWDGRTFTGWTTITSNLTSGTVDYAVIDDIVWLRINGNIAIPNSSSTNLFPSGLPTDIRPSSTLRMPCYFDGVGKPGACSIFSSGQIQFFQASGSAASSVSALYSWPLLVP